VRVSAGIFEAKVLVAPNSERAQAKAGMMTFSSPSTASGNVMVVNTRQ